MRLWAIHLCALTAAVLIQQAAVRADDAPIYDVPRLADIRIDGDAADWADRGFRVGILGHPDHRLKDAADFDAGFRLAWDDRGLLVLVTVTDHYIREPGDKDNLWGNDSIELWMSPRRGSPDLIQTIISPGLDTDHPGLRYKTFDYRQGAEAQKQPPEIVVARSPTRTGYIIEALLPWKDFGIEPKAGAEIGFQIVANDVDKRLGLFRTMWYPQYGANQDPTRMQRVRLAEKPSPPLLATAGGCYEKLLRARIRVAAVRDLVGKVVEIHEADRILYSDKLVEDAGRAGATIDLPMPPPGKPYGTLGVWVDGQLVSGLHLPDPDEQRAAAFMKEPISFDSSVFFGAQFPKCEFEHSAWVEDLIGAYTIKTTFYDKDYNPVASADQPGRYGAVIEIVPDCPRGIVYKRFRTLFRQHDDLKWKQAEMGGTVDLPHELGVLPAVVSEQSRFVMRQLKSQFAESCRHSDAPAVMLAGLAEMKAGNGPATVFDDPVARDRQWWVGLKRKLSGMDKRYPTPFVCPKPIAGAPAAIIRTGSLAEAGFKPDSVERLDALLSEWAANNDEGFAVCIARHGVIVLHKAYGQRDGRPMSISTKSWMASISKLMSGACLMMVADQGLIDLDQPAEKYLPALRETCPDAHPATLPTIRHLFTHTAGLTGHWGDDVNDFDQVIGGYYPFMQVGKTFTYDGAGVALGGKAIEMVTGESIPHFYKTHLLGPLGCDSTEAVDTYSSTYSTPLDMAKFGQMLLNRGAYGNKRFFSEKTFERMLPQNLSKLLGAQTQLSWGIGAVNFEDGLAPGTFGHSAASFATIRIDPTNDLVVVMTRNDSGRNFDNYHRRFLAAVAEGVVVETTAKR